MCLAIPGKIVSISEVAPPFRVGCVDFGGIRKEINLAFVPEAEIDDYVIVHVGVALHTVNELEASRMLEALKELEDLHEIQG